MGLVLISCGIATNGFHMKHLRRNRGEGERVEGMKKNAGEECGQQRNECIGTKPVEMPYDGMPLATRA